MQRAGVRPWYDERDNIVVGRILGIRSIISFHGETVAELRLRFEQAIDEYLAECKKGGMAPDKPASGKLLLRVPPEVRGRAGSPPRPPASA